MFRNSGLVRAASDVMVNGVTLTDKYGLTRQYLIGDPLFGGMAKGVGVLSDKYGLGNARTPPRARICRPLCAT